MHRLFAIFAACCTAGLLAAAPRPTVAPPRPLPTIHLNLPSNNPVVLIYPFDTASGMSAHVGTQVASIFSKELTQAGNITVLPIPSDVHRADFLTNARAHKADYYITGYVTPIGDSASVVVQVVSVKSGVIAFSQTSQVSTINDANSLALTSHDAILQMSGVNVDVSTTESATAAPSPEATNGAQFSLTHLFSHRRTAASSATAAPSTKPSRGVILLAVHGQTAVPSGELEHATSLLNHDLAAHFSLRYGGNAPANLGASADAICGAERDNTIATGLLAQKRVGGLRPRTQTTFTLQVWTCFGDVLYQTTETNFDVAKAVSDAVSDYITAHPNNG